VSHFRNTPLRLLNGMPQGSNPRAVTSSNFLTDRIASVKENFQGTGLITASEFVGLFERTLESWIEMKKKLLGSSDGSDGV